MSVPGRPPSWLEETVDAVMEDLQGASPIGGLVAAVTLVDGANGVSLGVLEPGRSAVPLLLLPEAEALQPDPGPAGSPGGGNFVSRSASGPALTAWVAEILQDDLAETEVARICRDEARRRTPARPMRVVTADPGSAQSERYQSNWASSGSSGYAWLLIAPSEQPTCA